MPKDPLSYQGTIINAPQYDPQRTLERQMLRAEQDKKAKKKAADDAAEAGKLTVEDYWDRDKAEIVGDVNSYIDAYGVALAKFQDGTGGDPSSLATEEGRAFDKWKRSVEKKVSDSVHQRGLYEANMTAYTTHTDNYYDEFREENDAWARLTIDERAASEIPIPHKRWDYENGWDKAKAQIRAEIKQWVTFDEDLGEQTTSKTTKITPEDAAAFGRQMYESDDHAKYHYDRIYNELGEEAKQEIRKQMGDDPEGYKSGGQYLLVQEAKKRLPQDDYVEHVQFNKDYAGYGSKAEIRQLKAYIDWAASVEAGDPDRVLPTTVPIKVVNNMLSAGAPQDVVDKAIDYTSGRTKGQWFVVSQGPMLNVVLDDVSQQEIVQKQAQAQQTQQTQQGTSAPEPRSGSSQGSGAKTQKVTEMYSRIYILQPEDGSDRYFFSVKDVGGVPKYQYEGRTGELFNNMFSKSFYQLHPSVKMGAPEYMMEKEYNIVPDNKGNINVYPVHMRKEGAQSRWMQSQSLNANNQSQSLNAGIWTPNQ